MLRHSSKCSGPVPAARYIFIGGCGPCHLLGSCKLLDGALTTSTQGLYILFELKKRPDKAAMCQAMGQLLAANILSRQHRPVVVVTDLKEDWRLLWVDKATIVMGSCSGSAAAVAIIQALVAQVGECHSSIQGHDDFVHVDWQCCSLLCLALPACCSPSPRPSPM